MNNLGANANPQKEKEIWKVLGDEERALKRLHICLEELEISTFASSFCYIPTNPRGHSREYPITGRKRFSASDSTWGTNQHAVC